MLGRLRTRLTYLMVAQLLAAVALGSGADA